MTSEDKYAKLHTLITELDKLMINCEIMSNRKQLEESHVNAVREKRKEINEFIGENKPEPQGKAQTDSSSSSPISSISSDVVKKQ